MLIYALRLFNTAAQYDEYHIVHSESMLDILDHTSALVQAAYYFNGVSNLQQILKPLNNEKAPLSTFDPKLSFEAGALVKRI